MTNIAKKALAFDLSLLSKYRTELMGISMLMVLVCHARLLGATFPETILSILALGDRGVELFFLLSGIGIYYSLSSFHKSEQGVLSWYKRRLTRILVPYLIIETPFWVYYCINNGLGVAEFLSYVSMISFWTDHVGPWFIAFLIPLYLISPLIYKLLSHSKNASIIACSFLILLSSVFAKHPFKDFGYNSSVLENIQFCVQRAPSYFIGMLMGPFVKERKKLSYIWLLVLPVVYILIPIIPLTRGSFRGWIIGVFLIIAFALIINLLDRTKIGRNVFVRLLSIVGSATLEIYIFADIIVNALDGLLPGTYYFVATVLLALILGILYHYIYLSFLSEEKTIKTV